MMRKFFTTTMTLLFVAIIHVSVYAQTTYYVKPTTTGSGTGADWDNASSDLQAIIDGASSGDQVFVATGIYKPSVILGGGADPRDAAFILKEGVKVYGGFAGTETGTDVNAITRNFVTNETVLSGDLDGNDVEGNDATKANNAYHVIVSYSNTLATVLDGFTITGGNADGTGNNEFFGAANLISRESGGGIFTRRSNPTFNNLSVKNNIATTSAGGIYMGGGSLVFSNSVVDGNKTTSSSGGGIYIAGYSSPRNTSQFTNVTISNNTAETTGGGIIVNSYSDPVLNNVVFLGNTAKTTGGAAYINSNNKVTFIDNTFEDNQATTSGGAIYLLGSLTNINISSFNGGSFKNNKVIGTNSTTGNGGAVYLASYSNPTFEDVDFEDNTANYGGGAIYSLGNSASARNSISITGGSFSGNKSDNYRGGAIYTSNFTNLIATDVIFSDNEALSQGGAVYTIGNVDSNNELSFNRCSFNDNISGASGGGIGVNSHSNVDMQNAIFTGNKANFGGGVFVVCASGNVSNLTIDSALFSGNVAGTGSTNSYYGGAIYLDNYTQSNLKNIILSGNIANAAGGIYVTGANSNVEVANAVFYGNQTVNGNNNGNGGAFTIASSAQATISGATFYGNTALGAGGALRILSGSTKVYNSIINGNTAGDVAATYDISHTGGTFELKNTLTQVYTTGDDAANGVVVNASPTYLFLSTDAENSNFLRLIPHADNPAIDSGDDDLIIGSVTTDLAGFARIGNGTVDMGAYENHTTLPVGLTTFTAKASDNGVLIGWITSSEINNDYFLLERSTDGVTYTVLAKVYSKGESGNTYNATDYSSLKGTNYYRLTQVDKDGTTVVLGQQAVDFDLEKQAGVKLYPNPVKGNILNLDFNGTAYSKLELVNISGKTLQIILLDSHAKGYSLDLSIYPSAIYLIRLTGDDKTVISKFIKQ